MIRGHGRFFRGMTPAELTDRILDDPDFQLQVLDERLFGRVSLEGEQRKTRLTVQVGLVVLGAGIACSLVLLLAHALGL